MTTIITSENELLELIDNVDETTISAFVGSINVLIDPPPTYVSVCRICQALERHDRLVTLNLSKVLIGIDNLLPLITLLQRNVSLQELRLCDNNFGPPEGKVLAHAIRDNLRFLDLANNAIGDPGASAFQFSRIEYLNLNANQIGDDGATALAQSKNVKTLKLMDNNIGGQGALALTTMLLSGSISESNLSSIDLTNNDFAVGEMLDLIENFLRDKQPVTSVDFVVSSDRQEFYRLRTLRDRLNFSWARN